MPRLPSLLQQARKLGVDRLDDRELIALILASGRDDNRARLLASSLLEDAGGLRDLWRLATHGLGGMPALGEQAAARLLAAFELGLRCLESPTAVRPVVRCSTDVLRVVGPRLQRLLHEQLWAVALDARHNLLAARRVAEGGVDSCAVIARDILRVVISLGASAFVLVHNHPSGAVLPSDHDLVLTRHVATAAELVGVPLVDHIVVGGAAHYSMADAGTLVTVSAGQLTGDARTDPSRPTVRTQLSHPPG